MPNAAAERSAPQDRAPSNQITVTVVYNGVEKTLDANVHQTVRALLEHAVRAFSITSNPHILSLFNDAGTELNDQISVEQAGIHQGSELLLRASAVKGGATQ
jgi:hypothetical protein